MLLVGSTNEQPEANKVPDPGRYIRAVVEKAKAEGLAAAGSRTVAAATEIRIVRMLSSSVVSVELLTSRSLLLEAPP